MKELDTVARFARENWKHNASRLPAPHFDSCSAIRSIHISIAASAYIHHHRLSRSIHPTIVAAQQKQQQKVHDPCYGIAL